MGDRIDRAPVLLVAVACAAMAAGSPPALAVDLERLVMPGPVIEGHADVESKCGKCHVPFRRGEQNALCLDCHEAVAADLDSGRGWHGRAPGLAQAPCRDCHTEHRGRDFDVVGLDPAAFRHDLTDFALEGAHRRVSCQPCHERGTKHRESPSDCFDCHRGDDSHRGRLGEKCGDCHSPDGWEQGRFDHDETEFPLEGRHDEVECGKCHPSQRYEKTPSDCGTCHRLDDVHLGRFGTGCEKCHSPDEWKTLRFDHDRDTEFPLRGSHRGAKCLACHVQGIEGAKPETDCFSCHRADDAHHGRNGNDCERCHVETDWESDKFDHDAMTEFPLRGAHQALECRQCHEGPVSEELDATCFACHGDDDVHRGQEGSRCQSCHNERGWTVDVFFDHEVTRFPLLGLHAVAACEQCHLSARFQDAATRCVACHGDDDIHLRRLGPDCARCHTPNGWKVWRFDHDEQTRFPLHDSHQGIDCHACHRVPVEEQIELSTGCYPCHARDDVHFGAYGRDCRRCHRETRWDDVTVSP
jgi:hypothetical protein